jgi:hydroxymethylbilane synthase
MRIATRKSPLALWQTDYVADRLRQAHPALEVTLLPLSTRGDEVLDRSLSEIGGKGLFLKELEKALLDGRADLAVHSLKDVPAQSPAGLTLSVVLPRASWADLWISRDGRSPAELPAGSRVGTSSLRRQSQLLKKYPELTVVPIRGSVQTRLDLIGDGHVDAVILAEAGIDRLGLDLSHRQALGPPDFIPAPGQGVIVVQCREDDERTQALLAPLQCGHTHACCLAERAVVAALGGDCRMPLAALASLDGGRIHLQARLASPDGRDCLDVELTGAVSSAQALGEQAGAALIDQGGMRILSQL